MSYDMDVNHEILRKQVMVGQFCNQVGCSQETATNILQAARWQIEVAFSLFFQDHGIVSSTSNNHNGGSLTDQVHYPGNSSTTMGQTSIGTSRTPYSCVPTNTPATPPSLPDTLAAFAQMKASSPDQRSMEPPVIQVQQFGEY